MVFAEAKGKFTVLFHTVMRASPAQSRSRAAFASSNAEPDRQRFFHGCTVEQVSPTFSRLPFCVASSLWRSSCCCCLLSFSACLPCTAELLPGPGDFSVVVLRLARSLVAFCAAQAFRLAGHQETSDPCLGPVCPWNLVGSWFNSLLKLLKLGSAFGSAFGKDTCTDHLPRFLSSLSSMEGP